MRAGGRLLADNRQCAGKIPARDELLGNVEGPLFLSRHHSRAPDSECKKNRRARESEHDEQENCFIFLHDTDTQALTMAVGLSIRRLAQTANIRNEPKVSHMDGSGVASSALTVAAPTLSATTTSFMSLSPTPQ